MPVTRHLLAMGGAFLADPDRNLKLERFFVSLTGLATPRVLFIPTASGDHEGYTLRFWQAFGRLGAKPEVLPLFRRTPQDLPAFVAEFDAIAVGGGNTRSMLAVWRDWGLDAVLRDAYARGIPVGGSSAGSICWFEHGITDSIAGPLTALECLGVVAGSNCPHYDSEPDRRPTYQRMVASGEVPAGHAADDGCGLHYVDDVFVGAVRSKPGAMAWRVERAADGTALETPITPRDLD